MNKIKEINRIEIKGITEMSNFFKFKKKYIYLILSLLFTMNFIIGTSSNKNKTNFNKRKIDSYNQYVKIKVNKIGSIRILGDRYFYTSEIYYNGIKMNMNEYGYLYPQNISINVTSLENENEIVIKWNKKFDSTNRMFYECFDIISIDLSNFDTSSVTNMEFMFSCCSSLTSLDLSNFNTQKVTDMKNMFYNCNSLTS